MWPATPQIESVGLASAGDIVTAILPRSAHLLPRGIAFGASAWGLTNRSKIPSCESGRPAGGTPGNRVRRERDNDGGMIMADCARKRFGMRPSPDSGNGGTAPSTNHVPLMRFRANRRLVRASCTFAALSDCARDVARAGATGRHPFRQQPQGPEVCRERKERPARRAITCRGCESGLKRA